MNGFGPDKDAPQAEPDPATVAEGERLTEELLEALKPLAPVSEPEKDRLWERALDEWSAEQSGNADDQ